MSILNLSKYQKYKRKYMLQYKLFKKLTFFIKIYKYPAVGMKGPFKR